MKRVWSAGFFICVALILGGCTIKLTDQIKTSGSMQEEKVKLRFSWWGETNRNIATLAVIEQFETLYPNIEIEAEYGSSDGYNDRLTTELAKGTAPDIIQIDPGYMSSHIRNNPDYFLDYLEYGFDVSGFDEDYLKREVNGRYGDRQLGLPTGIAGAAVLVNEELAAKIGLDLREQYTWQDILEYGKRVREYDDSMYFLAINKEYIWNMCIGVIRGQITGTTTFNNETKELQLTKEEIIIMYEYFKQLIDNEVIAPLSYSNAYTADGLHNDPNWIAGKYVCMFCYTSNVDAVAEANPNTSYYAGMLPKWEGQKMDNWGCNCPQLVCVNNNSEYIDEALLFVDYFFNDPAAMETLGTTRSIPPTERALEVCVEKGLVSDIVADSVHICQLYESMEEEKYDSFEVKQIFIDQIEAVGYGALTAEEAAEETIEMLEYYINAS